MHYYYSSSKRVLTSRIDCLADPETFYLYYYDKEFSQYDWTVEPTESLEELYRQRAQQIRDEYDYIVLAYSGGIDSTNMLEAFYYNNIHIDEILVVGALSQDSSKGSDENHNGDLYHNVFPTLNSMSLPNTRITVEDYSLLFDDPTNLVAIRDFGGDWIRGIGGSFLSPHNIYWRNIYEHVNFPNKKGAILFAIDKPWVEYDQLRKSLYFQFTDFGFNAYTPSFENFTRINFYWEPKAIKVLLKQLQTINKFFINKVFENKSLTIPEFFHFRDRIAETLVYPLKNPLVFRSPKVRTNIISPRDRFLLQKKDSDIYKVYREGIFQLRKRIQNIEHVGEVFYTRKYYLNNVPQQLV